MDKKPTHAYNFPPGLTLLEHHSHCHLCKPKFPIYFLSTGTSAVCKMESWLHLRVSERNSATLQETATVSYVKSKLLVTQSSIKSNSHLPPPLSVSINKKSFWKRKNFMTFQDDQIRNGMSTIHEAWFQGEKTSQQSQKGSQRDVQ